MEAEVCNEVKAHSKPNEFLSRKAAGDAIEIVTPSTSVLLRHPPDTFEALLFKAQGMKKKPHQ